jgi:predicted AAA+ superfamily ATPase
VVRDALVTLPVVVVTGLRQAGKTTFLQRDRVFRGYRYLSLDDYAVLEAARREPEALLEGDGPVILDEAQRSPELLTAVKRSVDRRRVPGRFVLSGSANLALLRGVSESLAGRALYLTLRPFSRRERTGRIATTPWLPRFLEKGKPPQRREVKPVLVDEILDGGMPPVTLGEAGRRDLWFLGYEQTYLERDLRDLAQVADLVSFRDFVRLAALRTGQVLNRSDLARDARLPASTATRYLDLLETSFVISRLAPHLRSRVTRLIKSPKIFVSDSGLAAHLTGVDDIRPGADEPLRGAMFETWVHQNLASLLEAHLPRAELTYWNVQGRHEVDFVATSGRRSIAVEVKAASRFTDRDLRGLRAFLHHAPGCIAGILGYNGTETVSLGDNLHAVPLAVLIS